MQRKQRDFIFMVMPVLLAGVVLEKRYRVESVIGSGGYATVYRVMDMVKRTLRAMKEVTDPDPAIRQQFELEASLLIATDHPHINIPRGYAHFSENGRVYLVMDYIEGKDLEQLLSNSLMQKGVALNEAQVLQWFIPICEALEVMHTRRVPIIHRDIKPANIKLDAAGVPMLIDFGLAKLALNGPTNQAAQGVTPGYAPPEQYLAQGLTDARSDVYGVGATLYTLLTGREPAEAPNRLMAEAGKSGKELVHPHFFNPDISPATANLIMRAMDISASQRQQTTRELRDDIFESLNELQHGPRLGVARTLTNSVGISQEPTGKLALAIPPRPLSPENTRFLPNYPAYTAFAQPIPWIDLGGPLVRRMGKFAIFLSSLELYWGLLCTGAFAGMLGTNNFRTQPSLLVVAGALVWVGVVIVLTVFVVRVLDRPIARRGHIGDVRRWLQGTSLIVLWLGTNGLALFSLSLPTFTTTLLALAFLALASILVGLLSLANVLA